jgi:hypothetical protein
LLYLKLNRDFEQAWNELNRVFSNTSVNMRKVKEWFAAGLEMNEVYHGEDRPLELGPEAIIMCRSVERAIKGTDRLVLKKEDNHNYVFFDRFSEKSEFEFPKPELAVALRRFPFLDSMDITGKTDFCVANPGKATEKAMNAFYTAEKSDDYLKRLSNESWKRILRRGSSKVAISARADLAAPGTRLIAVYSKNPMFLAGAYGYNVTGFTNETEEKLFVLWMNSTLALLQLIAKSTITRGSWVKLEEFTTEQVVLPNASNLTASEKNKINELWKSFSKQTFSSLLEQLKSSGGTRRQLDAALLELLGVHKAQVKQVAEQLEKGALAAILMLNATMKKPAKQKKTRKSPNTALTEFMKG